MPGSNGTNLLILVNTGTPSVPAYEAVGCQRDCTIEEASDTIDVSCKDSRAQRVLPGRFSGTVSLDHLYIDDDAGYLALQEANRDGELILLAKEWEGVVTETVDAKIDSMSESYPDQDAAVVSTALTIDGFWTPVGS